MAILCIAKRIFLTGLEEFLGLMAKEGFLNPYFPARLCHSVLESQHFASDLDCARHFAKQALKSFVTSEGESGDRSLEIKSWLVDNSN